MAGEKRSSSVSQFTTGNPADTGLVKRLIEDNRRVSGRNSDNPPDLGVIATVLRRNIRNGSDYENIIKALPWLKLPMDILISSIISPGDLVKQELNVRSIMQGADNNLLSQLDKVIRTHFIDEMQIPTQIADWLKEILFTKGSHPIMIIPESTLDKMMKVGNYSEEGYKSLDDVDGNWYKPLGILGFHKSAKPTATEISFESEFHPQADSNILRHTIELPKQYQTPKSSHYLPYRVTDNPMVLRMPAVQAMRRQVIQRKGYGEPAFEAEVKRRRSGKSDSPLTKEQVYANHFKRGTSKTQRLVVMPNSSRDDITERGHPLMYHLPAECVATAFIPGMPEQPYGFWIALDNTGYPASYLSRLDFYDDIRAGWSDTGSGNQQAGNLMAMAKEISSGSIRDYSDNDIDRITHLNSDILERELVARFQANNDNGEVKIGMTDGFNKMMLARWAANQFTTLLYVPAEYMVYMAVEYSPFGTGKSLLEDLKEHAAQLVSIKVANNLQALKNAIPGKDLNIKLDPKDKNPEETIVETLREALALMFYHLPTNVSSTADVATQLQQSSLNVNIEGNEYYPDMKSSITDREKVNQSPDMTLYQELKDEMQSAIGVPSELTNNINQPEFAVTAVHQNILLRKRVVSTQTMINPFFTDLIRIYTMNSGPLCKELMEIVEGNAKMLPKDYTGEDSAAAFLIDYINSIHASLPEPVIDDMEFKAGLIEKFKAALDLLAPSWVASTFFNGYDPEDFKTEIDQFTEAYKALAMRQWARKHNITMDLDLFTTDDEGQVVFTAADDMVNHSDMLAQSLARMISGMAEKAKERNKPVKKALKDDEKGKKNVEELTAETPEPSEGIVPTDGAEDDGLGQPEETSDSDNTGEFDSQDLTSDTPTPNPEEEEEEEPNSDENPPTT